MFAARARSVKGPAMTQNRDLATTFAKGLAVLRAFGGDAPALSLAEIARRAGLDRAAARRLVLTLVAEGYVRQDGRVFSLTPRVLALSGGFLQAHGFGLRVQPVLDRHAARLEASIALAVRDGTDVVLMAQSSPRGGHLSFGFTPGSRLPLLHTSLGRMLLARAPGAEAAALIEAAPMQAHTARSLTDRAAIARAVQRAARDGHAVTADEFEPGILGLSLPVGETGAVLGVSLPRLLSGDPERMQGVIATLQVCAAELAQGGGLEGL